MSAVSAQEYVTGLSENDLSDELPDTYLIARISVWSAFSARGLLPVVFYDGSLDAPAYRSVLDRGLNETASILYPERWTLVPDEAPWNAAAFTQD